jgi:hypothetical protein
MDLFNLFAFELLGIDLGEDRDILPLPQNSRSGFSPYLTDFQIRQLGHIVCELLPGSMTISDWRRAKREERVADMTIALKRRLAQKPTEPEKQQTTRKNQHKKINTRMFEKMLADTQSGSEECFGWTCGGWAKFLKCSEPSVVATRAWKQLKGMRDLRGAEQAKDRRGDGIGRRKGDYRLPNDS